MSICMHLHLSCLVAFDDEYLLVEGFESPCTGHVSMWHRTCAMTCAWRLQANMSTLNFHGEYQDPNLYIQAS